jgi:hypothetical protein
MSKLRRTLIVSAVIGVLSVLTVLGIRSSQAWERDLDRGLQSVQQTR